VCFPQYVAAWYVFFNHFLTQLNDLRREDEALFDRIPAFVPYAIGGTCLFFTSFTFVQWRYLYISPDYFWKTGVQIVLALSHSITLPLTLLPVFTEYIYALLSLSSKMFLGLLLYFNVLMFSSFSEALSDTVANNASPPPPPVARM